MTKKKEKIFFLSLIYSSINSQILDNDNIDEKDIMDIFDEKLNGYISDDLVSAEIIFL